ncbi:MAG: RIP metalloprotease RseP [Candidatus Acetothermia bacterium]|jgi:regulator of sigma E protease|nr:RIP metalloprotease RseP [Candidatus Acetothermia bacterium]
MITFLVFLGALLFLVGVHEGGHFLAAKLLGMAVEEFALGFGPVLWSWRRGETRYSIRILPLGGFVRLSGEDREAEGVPFERTYYGRPAWVRFLVSLSGPTANVVLAVAVVLGAILALGLPRVQVAGLVPGRPAEGALKVGDVVLKVDGRSVWTTAEVGPAIQAVAPSPVAFRVRRGGEELELSIVPAYSQEDEKYLVGAYFLPQVFLAELVSLAPDAPLAQAGLRSGDRVDGACGRQVRSLSELYGAWQDGCRTLDVDRAGDRLTVILPGLPPDELLAGASFRALPPVYDRPGFGEGVVLTFREIGGAMGAFVTAIRGLLTRTIPAGEAVTGPVGIAGILSQGVRAGPLAVLLLVALIGLNLALFNLIPFPALDGARMAFALYEMVTRRKVSPQVETGVHATGFVILFALLLMITFQDLLRLFG